MVFGTRKIIWSPASKKEKRKILKYWNDRNKSQVFSKKLNIMFSNAIKHLIEFPESGKSYEETNFRYIIVKDYLIFYKYDDSIITILKVWDGNRNPDNLEI